MHFIIYVYIIGVYKRNFILVIFKKGCDSINSGDILKKNTNIYKKKNFIVTKYLFCYSFR